MSERIDKLKEQISTRKEETIGFNTIIIFVFLVFSLVFLLGHGLFQGQDERDWNQEGTELQHNLRQLEFKFRNQILDFKRNQLVQLKNDSSYQYLFTNGNERILNEIIISKIKERFGYHRDSLQIKSNSNFITKFLWTLNFIEVELIPDFNDAHKDISILISDEGILYDNDISIKTRKNESFRYINYSICVFIILIFILIISFRSRTAIAAKSNTLKQLLEEIKEEDININKANQILKKATVSKNEIEELRNLFINIERHRSEIRIENIVNTSLLEEVVKSENRADDIFKRSNFMLFLGILVSVVGIIVFYLTLPDTKDLQTSKNEFLIIVRPSLILVFIQSIAFFILRQYRRLIEDYKQFYNNYTINQAKLAAYQVSNHDGLNDEIKLKLIGLLTKTNNSIEKVDEETEKSQEIIEVMKQLISKL